MLQKIRTVVFSRKALLVAAPTLGVLLFYWAFLFTGDRYKGGDFDYYAQLYEAFRATVLEYHQFPIWNPWAAGGTPLLANPQFGLISIQAVTTLLFGTIMGLKLAFVAYGLIGFWGMYTVARQLAGASYINAVLISFIWIMSGFFYHHSIDHITLALFHFFPWLFYLFVRRHTGRNWLWLALVLSLVALTSPHYAMLMSIAVLLLAWAFEQLNLKWQKAKLHITFDLPKKDLLLGLKVGAVFILLAGYRIYLSYGYLKQYPRPAEQLAEPANTIELLLKALFWPVEKLNAIPGTHWGWTEYSMNIGIASGILVAAGLLALLWKFAVNPLRFTWLARLWKDQKVFCVAFLIAVVAFLLAMGDQGSLSLFNILRHLPGFTETRVASRWLIFTVFFALFLLAAWKPQKRAWLLTLLLAVSVVQLFAFYTRPADTFMGVAPQAANYQQPFEQFRADKGQRYPGFGNSNPSEALLSYYYATTQNRGSVIMDDSFINTYTTVPTLRCGSNKLENCGLVLSGNARVTYWSPNRITLERTGTGPIELNMNPGRDWVINGARPFAKERKAETEQRFIIDPSGNTVQLKVAPRNTPFGFFTK